MANSPLQTNLPEAEPDISVNRLIFIGVITRLVTDTAVQFFFPFLPVIAEGLRTSTVTAGRLVSLRSAMGLLSPAFGYQATLRGYRTVMRFGLLLAAVGYLIVGLSNSVWLTAIGMVLGGLGTFSFIPILQAYLSAKLPFHRRARGLGMLEYSWALAGIVGLYLVGLLIDATNWRVPLFVLSGLLLVAFVGYARLPATNQTTKPIASQSRFTWRSIVAFFDLGANGRSAYAVLLVISLNMMAAMNVFISYGTWLDREYGLGAAQLGTAALILGIADLGGSVLMSLIGDKFGLRRSVVVGTLATGIGYALLPAFNQGVVLAVVGLVIARFGFEYTVVALIALVSEQAPAHRGKMMTLAAAAALLGSSTAGLFGPWVYDHYQVMGLSLISATIMAFCLVLLRLFVRERGD
ncbi:MFS transporter [Candidatus Leptofilum sp.]|uniref:MFS transporter n=1 Tax=Candidatus Leptofilum sp. TaxID=3241576 RepID=UPI003B5AA188